MKLYNSWYNRTLTPAFSANALGSTSKLSANFLIEYCSKPGHVCNKKINHISLSLSLSLSLFIKHTSPKVVSCLASSISVAPAPGTNLGSFVRALNVLTASSIALSTSSIMLSVEPRITMVDTRLSSFSVCMRKRTSVVVLHERVCGFAFITLFEKDHIGVTNLLYLYKVTVPCLTGTRRNLKQRTRGPKGVFQ